MSSLSTKTYKKGKQGPAKSALHAEVAHLRQELSQSRAEMEFYFSSVTESLALLEEVRAGLVAREQETGQPDPLLGSIALRHQQLADSLIQYWPAGLECQERALKLLELDGLVPVMGTTHDGYASLSSDLILENVARAIALTKEHSQKPQS